MGENLLGIALFLFFASAWLARRALLRYHHRTGLRVPPSPESLRLCLDCTEKIYFHSGAAAFFMALATFLIGLIEL
jgi:hypothetical protein